MIVRSKEWQVGVGRKPNVFLVWIYGFGGRAGSGCGSVSFSLLAAAQHTERSGSSAEGRQFEKLAAGQVGVHGGMFTEGNEGNKDPIRAFSVPAFDSVWHRLPRQRPAPVPG